MEVFSIITRNAMRKKKNSDGTGVQTNRTSFNHENSIVMRHLNV